MRTLKARFTREGTTWVVELEEEPRVHSFGRTLAAARENILDAAALWYQEQAADLTIEGAWDLGGQLGDEVAAALQARSEASRADSVAALLVHRAVMGLVGQDYPLRDIASIFGLSHQRVHQLVVGGRDAPVYERGALPGTEAERSGFPGSRL